MIARFSIVFASVSVLAGAALCAAGGIDWLLNALGAAIGSYSAAVFSFFSYKKIVADGAKDFSLGAPEAAAQNPDRGENQDGDQAPDDKISLKTRGFYALKSFSARRLLGYAALILIFFALNFAGRFEPIAFLIALGILPVSAIIFAALSARAGR